MGLRRKSLRSSIVPVPPQFLRARRPAFGGALLVVNADILSYYMNGQLGYIHEVHKVVIHNDEKVKKGLGTGYVETTIEI